MIPGEYICLDADIVINAELKTIALTVSNSGDRPIQVGSHYHFYEVNSALIFDREIAKGYRLNILSGTAVRFEPGQSKDVSLVPYRGGKEIFGFNKKVMGNI